MAVVSPGELQDAELIGSWFVVELDNGITGQFSDASGLSIEIEVVENTLSSADTTTRKRPGTTKYSEITLKRTLSPDRAFWDWAKSIRDGKTEFRTDGAVLMFDISGGTIVGNWKFTNAWPSKWSASDLDVGTDDIMQEEVTLQVEMLERVV
jgi:phage tail-like protein